MIVEVAGIVPPFGFKFRMRKMILRKGESSPRKGALEVLSVCFGGSEKESKKESSNDEIPLGAFWTKRDHLSKEKCLKPSSITKW